MAEDLNIVLKTKLDTAEADKQLSEFKKRAETSELKIKIASESGKNNIQNEVQNTVKSVEKLAQIKLKINIDDSGINDIDNFISKVPDKYKNTFSKSFKNIGSIDKFLDFDKISKQATDGLKGVNEALSSVREKYASAFETFNKSSQDESAYSKLVDSLKEIDSEFGSVSKTAKKFNDDLSSQSWIDIQDKKIAKLKSNFATMKEEWSRALEIPELKAEIDAFEAKLGDVDAQNLPNANAAFMALKANIRAAGADCKSFGAQLKDVVKSASGFVSIASVFALLRRSIAEVVGSVKELNSAMVEFRKVTNLSASGYDNFLKSSAKTAKQIGTDLVDMVSGTADFVKLGYGVNDATNLATQANILYKVGDGFNNIGEATDATIASMKAYGIEATNVSSIVDKLNKVSNETSIDTAGLADAITRSASALNMGGLDLDRSLALIVAGNETVRDASAVGTGLKTLSARIRGAKTELQSLGEEEDEYVNSTSKLRQSILDLTKVDIMADVDKGQYKDLYTILGEISKVYDKLSDVDKANVMEILFGKRNVNIGASIMQNFDQAEKALNSAQNATGSAMAEHERWMQSIEASEAKASAAFQEFSNSIMSSGLIKFYYDAKTGFLGFLTAISDKLGTLSATAPMLAGVLSAWKNIGISKVNMPYPTYLSAVA